MKEPTLLAEELLPDGTLSDEGIERMTAAVSRAVDAAVRLGVDHLYPFVTAAVRDAVNRDEVIDRIQAGSGIRPQFLSGEQEARLTYFAARRWYGWSAGRLLLIDIGGGSMELVLGRDVEPELAVSLPLGAGRLTREFRTADPPTRTQLKVLRRHVRDTLSEVLDRLRWEGPPRRVVATSKTSSSWPASPAPRRSARARSSRGNSWCGRTRLDPAAGPRPGGGPGGVARHFEAAGPAGGSRCGGGGGDVVGAGRPERRGLPVGVAGGHPAAAPGTLADSTPLPLQPLTRHPDDTVHRLRPAGEQPVPS